MALSKFRYRGALYVLAADGEGEGGQYPAGAPDPEQAFEERKQNAKPADQILNKKYRSKLNTLRNYIRQRTSPAISDIQDQMVQTLQTENVKDADHSAMMAWVSVTETLMELLERSLAAVTVNQGARPRATDIQALMKDVRDAWQKKIDLSRLDEESNK